MTQQYYKLNPDNTIDVTVSQTWTGKVHITPRLREYVQEYIDDGKTFQEALYYYLNGDIETKLVWHGDHMEEPFSQQDPNHGEHTGRQLQIPGYNIYQCEEFVYLPVPSDHNNFVDTMVPDADIAECLRSADTEYVVKGNFTEQIDYDRYEYFENLKFWNQHQYWNQHHEENYHGQTQPI